MLQLFYSPGSCALASHIALEEAGAEFRLRRVDFQANEQRTPDYLKINPKGRVPVLATDRGILTENPAILLYVAQTHPAARVAPLDDPFQLARMQAFNSYLCSTVHVAHAHAGRGYRWADDAAAIESMKKKVPQNVGDCYGLIETEMLAGPWVMGDAYSVADGYLFTVSGWLERDKVDINRFPKVRAHRDAMLARPAVQRAMAAQKAGVSS